MQPIHAVTLSRFKSHLMYRIVAFVLLAAIIAGCKKEKNQPQLGCDMQKIYTDNEKKLTLAKGVWGTVASSEGDCMPSVSPGPPVLNTCGYTCPVKRTIKVYAYTLATNATHYLGDFYTDFNSTLVAETESDENGFYQVNVPDGHYSLAIVEDGKLYANTWDTAGGLTPMIISNDVQKVNLTMTYKMTY